MRTVTKAVAVSTFALLFTAGAALAETKVTVSNVHLCCGMCVTAVNKTLTGIEGVEFKADQKAGTVAITATSDEIAQKAVSALQEAGFYGKSDNEKITFAAVKAPEGKVKRLELTGVHNCCGQCNTTIKTALAGVEGITANTAKAKEASFVVEGDFSAAAVIDALLAKGFAVKVKQ
jgi:copper chaperone CopZ